MGKKTEKIEVCTCEKCGNEAEMIITCGFVPVEREDKKEIKKETHHITCKHCGNEADMILEE